jgi:hypothetical protein
MNINAHLSLLSRLSNKFNSEARLLNIPADLTESSYLEAVNQLKMSQDLSNKIIRLIVAPDIIGAALSLKSVNHELVGIDTYLPEGAWYIGMQDKGIIYSPGA